MNHPGAPPLGRRRRWPYVRFRSLVYSCLYGAGRDRCTIVELRMGITRQGLAFNAKISPRQAEAKVLAFAFHGEHHLRGKLLSPASVWAVLAHAGYEHRELIEDLRQYPRPVPIFQNLLGAGASYVSRGARTRLIDHADRVIEEFEGPGVATSQSYKALFEYAFRLRDRAVRKTSLFDYQSSLIFGIAAIEALLNWFALLWNRQRPDRQVTETDDHRVSIEEKIDEWLPQFTGGKELDKSRVEWHDFKILKETRDTAVHPKLGQITLPLEVMADHLNRFRTGIAGLAIETHKLVGWGVPAPFLTAFYSPRIEVIGTDELLLS